MLVQTERLTPDGPPLTAKQAAFVRAMHGKGKGNATESASLAGYVGDRRNLRSTASRLNRDPKIREALRLYAMHMDSKGADGTIATPKRIRQYWSEVMTDPKAPHGVRLKASEHLARSNGMFVDVKEVRRPSAELTDEELRAEVARRLQGDETVQ